jgi:hypothetical protein
LSGKVSLGVRGEKRLNTTDLVQLILCRYDGDLMMEKGHF